jgi:PadR family transcriptional regulator PadR
MERPHGELSGAELREVTKLQTGTLYPILMRLEQAGWLESRWEVEDPHSLGRPRRRYYQVTAAGARQARTAVQSIKSVIGGLAWA